MATWTQTNADAFIPEIWANAGLQALENNVIMASLANRFWDGQFKNDGDTINVPKPLSFTAAVKSGNTAVTVSAPTASTVAVVLNKHVYVSIAPEDIVRALVSPERLKRITNDALAALAQKIDVDGVTEAANFTGTTKGTQGTASTVAVILASRKVLLDAKMPVNEGANFVMGTQTDSDLQQISLFQQANTSGTTSVVEAAKMGRKFGFEFIVDQNIDRTAAVSTAGDKNLAFHRDALTLATAPLMLPGGNLGVQAVSVEKNGIGIRLTQAWDHSNLAVQATYDVLYGWKAVRPELGLISYGA
jgi:hypothetical protein